MLARTMLSIGTCRLWGKKAMSGTAKGQAPHIAGRWMTFADQNRLSSPQFWRLAWRCFGL